MSFSGEFSRAELQEERRYAVSSFIRTDSTEIAIKESKGYDIATEFMGRKVVTKRGIVDENKRF